MNIDKSKVMVFRKSGHLRPNLSLKYDRLILKLSQNISIWELVLRLVVHLILHNRLCQDKLKRLSLF